MSTGLVASLLRMAIIDNFEVRFRLLSLDYITELHTAPLKWIYPSRHIIQVLPQGLNFPDQHQCCLSLRIRRTCRRTQICIFDGHSARISRFQMRQVCVDVTLGLYSCKINATAHEGVPIPSHANILPPSIVSLGAIGLLDIGHVVPVHLLEHVADAILLSYQHLAHCYVAHVFEGCDDVFDVFLQTCRACFSRTRP